MSEEKKPEDIKKNPFKEVSEKIKDSLKKFITHPLIEKKFKLYFILNHFIDFNFRKNTKP